MKKFLSVLLTIALLLSALPLVFAGAATVTHSGTCGDNLTWTFDDEGLLTISGTGDIPSYISADSVPWFSYRENITKVNIVSGVTSIGKSAFSGCTALANVTIPDSVTSIGESAFYSCTALTNVTIPDGVKTIGSHAFNNCTSLQSIIIPDSVTSISNAVFSDTAYYNNADNWSDKVLYIGNYLIKAKEDLAGEYTVKDGTKLIASAAFHSCSSLTGITIPDSVTSICDFAFYNCTALTSINIPDSVTSIGSRAFRGCTSLTNITIPDSVTSIGGSAFPDCTALKNINIPNSVTSIGDSAFIRCTSLTNITIPAGVTNIGDYAFYECTALASISIYNPNCVIGHAAIPTGAVIYGYSGSTAETYATANGNTFRPLENEEHTHNYTATVTKQADCTEKGIKTYLCFCGDTYTQVITALGHSYGEWVTTLAPTVDADGEEARTCTVCGATQTQTLPKLPPPHVHEYTSSITKQPGCTETGVRTYNCACGATYTEVITATGHSYENGTCTACGAKDPNYDDTSTSSDDSFCKLFKSYFMNMINKILNFFLNLFNFEDLGIC